MSQLTCPICGEGTLHTNHVKHPVEYKNRSEEIDMLFDVCDICGVEQANSEQLKTNKRSVMAFRKHVDGLLSGSEVRAIRLALGLTQKQASEIFGGGPTAFSKYEADDVAQSESMDMLLRMVDFQPVNLEVLKRISSSKDSNSSKSLETDLPLQFVWETLILDTKETEITAPSKVVKTGTMQIETDWHQYKLVA